MERYALYFAPHPETDLAGFGASWLGRDAFTDTSIPRDDDGGMLIDPDRLDDITASPRRYGFHATIKAPFELAPDQSREALIEALEAFAAKTPAFEAPPLELTSHFGYTTLVLSEPSAAMEAFAAACVRDFDPFRAALTPEDRERRRPDRLSERQRAYLDEWGYPYVFKEFFFHMTLSERLTDPEEIAYILEILEPIASVLSTQPLAVDALCLFHQPGREAPFKVVHRAPLSG